MSLLCAILVVSIHVQWPHEMPLSLGWFIYEAVANGIARIAVPFFFVVSGFFLAQHFEEAGWWGRRFIARTEVTRKLRVALVACQAVCIGELSNELIKR